MRDALRVIESESLHALTAGDLAERAGVSKSALAIMVRRDLNAGLRKMPDILSTMEQDGRGVADIFASAVKRNPYVMWWNASKDFREAIFLHLTYQRFLKLLAKFGLKQAIERTHKRSVVEGMSAACPVLADALRGPRKALRSPLPVLPFLSGAEK